MNTLALLIIVAALVGLYVGLRIAGVWNEYHRNEGYNAGVIDGYMEGFAEASGKKAKP